MSYAYSGGDGIKPYKTMNVGLIHISNPQALKFLMAYEILWEKIAEQIKIMCIVIVN